MVRYIPESTYSIDRWVAAVGEALGVRPMAARMLFASLCGFESWSEMTEYVSQPAKKVTISDIPAEISPSDVSRYRQLTGDESRLRCSMFFLYFTPWLCKDPEAAAHLCKEYLKDIKSATPRSSDFGLLQLSAI
ncbi:hypothetical protein DOK_11551 [gamma proteobacterium BDW918]|nr:hypothetical protein DOK_11551 [gamma proteobacterium BDW918]